MNYRNKITRKAVDAWRFQLHEHLPIWFDAAWVEGRKLGASVMIMVLPTGCRVVEPGEWIMRHEDGGITIASDFAMEHNYEAMEAEHALESE